MSEINISLVSPDTPLLQDHFVFDFFSSLAGRCPNPQWSNEIIPLLLNIRSENISRIFSVDQEPPTIKPWEKESTDKLQGGGVISLIRGTSLEKGAINMSLVWGDEYPSLEPQYQGKPFCAAGVSIVIHPYNPYAPIAHMNVRVFSVGDEIWIGGGADLTPLVPRQEDTTLFHDSMKQACDQSPQGNYSAFKAWCDDYFYIQHRKETRGVGGIFFDYLPVKKSEDLDLLSAVSDQFSSAYREILKKTISMDFDSNLKEKHLHWRARYAEFNLIYDRGTRFGLMSGGNPEAILCSMPPVVKW
jgi:coproporphyrinogen III oxidase